MVVKSQVLTGGRMKAGGVKFADSPEEAEAHAAEILELKINGQMPRGVLVDPKAQVAQEYYAGVVWDGTRKRPMMLFSDMGGIDIEEVAERHPEHVGRGHLSNLLPISDFQAKQVIAQTGVTGSELNRATPILARLAQLMRDCDMTLAEINPLARLEDGGVYFASATPTARPHVIVTGSARSTPARLRIARAGCSSRSFSGHGVREVAPILMLRQRRQQAGSAFQLARREIDAAREPVDG